MLSAIKLSDFLTGTICFESCFRDTAEACSDAAGSSIQLYYLESSQQSLGVRCWSLPPVFMEMGFKFHHCNPNTARDCHNCQSTMNIKCFFFLYLGFKLLVTAIFTTSVLFTAANERPPGAGDHAAKDW